MSVVGGKLLVLLALYRSSQRACALRPEAGPRVVACGHVRGWSGACHSASAVCSLLAQGAARVGGGAESG